MGADLYGRAALSATQIGNDLGANQAIRHSRSTNQRFTLSGTSNTVGNTIPVPCFRPVATNKQIALDIMPNGTVVETTSDYGIAWADICAQDCQEASPGGVGVQCLHLASHTPYMEVGSRAFSATSNNSGTALPLRFRVGKDTGANVKDVLQCNVDGTIQIFADSIVANGSVAVTMTSLGPTGSRTTIQKWWKIKDASGNPFYIPLY